MPFFSTSLNFNIPHQKLSFDFENVVFPIFKPFTTKLTIPSLSTSLIKKPISPNSYQQIILYFILRYKRERSLNFNNLSKLTASRKKVHEALRLNNQTKTTFYESTINYPYINQNFTQSF